MSKETVEGEGYRCIGGGECAARAGETDRGDVHSGDESSRRSFIVASSCSKSCVSNEAVCFFFGGDKCPQADRGVVGGECAGDAFVARGVKRVMSSLVTGVAAVCVCEEGWRG